MAPPIYKRRNYPTIRLFRKGQYAVLHMRWSGHLLLPEPEPGRCLSAEDMAAHLRKLRKSVGKFLLPQAAPGQIPEMRCFDPNKCCCLDFGDKYPPNARWSLAPPLKPLKQISGTGDAQEEQ